MSQQLKTLYIMCGPAGGGKSTWIRSNAAPGTSAHISRDRIRFKMVKEDEYYFSREKEVYMEFTRQIFSALCREWVDEVYADATHLNQKSRAKVIREIDSLYGGNNYELIAVVVKPKIETCLAQNAQRTGRECVPETVIRNMYETFEDPALDDIRYDKIIYVEEV